MKVALVNPNQYTSYPQPPLGLLTIASVIRQAGHEVKLVDANLEKLKSVSIIERVYDADIMGITAVTPTITEAKRIADTVKDAIPRMPIILGGAHGTLLPEETLHYGSFDYIVQGEGEDAVKTLLRWFRPGGLNGRLIGVMHRGKGIIIDAGKAPDVKDLDALPILAYDLLGKDYQPHPPHGLYPPAMPVITSRGCPYSCTFCSKPVFGNHYRAQSPERVLDELIYLKRLGVREIIFYDDIFTLDRRRIMRLMDLMTPLRLHWTCETRVDLVDGELLQEMKRAGCFAIAYGIESASSEVREGLCKRIKDADIVSAIYFTRKFGIQTIGYFMIGSPNETPQSIKDTIALAKALKLDYAQFAVTTPFPGSVLYDKYVEQGKPIDWESFSYLRTDGKTMPVFESEHFTKADILKAVQQANRSFYLNPVYILRRLKRLLGSRVEWGITLRGLRMFLKLQ